MGTKTLKFCIGPHGRKNTDSHRQTKYHTFTFISFFSIIIFNNFLGVSHYVFTTTSHIAITLSLALPLWLTFIIFGWINNTQHIFAHLVPQGTPPVLIPFMVCIETISNIIRPWTLAVRLAANIIAGHLLLTLLGNTGPFLSYSLLSLLVVTQIAPTLFSFKQQLTPT